MNRFQKKLIKVFQILLVMGACVRAKSLRSHRTLGDPMGVGLPGSSVHGILQAWLLEQAAMPFSRDLPDPRIKHKSLTFPVLASRLFTASNPGEAPIMGDLDLQTQIPDLGSFRSSPSCTVSFVTKSYTHNFFIKVFFFQPCLWCSLQNIFSSILKCG